MEVFGVVAGGVSLLELVAKSLLLLAKHTRKAKQANVERLQIIEQINKFYGLLLDATALLNDGEDGEDSSFLDNAQLCSLRKVLDEKGRTVEELKRHLEGLLDKLVSNVNQQGLKGVVLKVMWPLDEVEVRATIKIMEALQGQIGTALSIDTNATTRVTLREIREIAKNQIEDQEYRKKKAQEQEKQKELKSYLDWLVHPDPNLIFLSATNKLISDTKTGSWLSELDEYIRFMDGPRSMLWLRGPEGCGKTVLCATIIESIQQLHRFDENVALAFWHFSEREKQTRSIDNMLRSLLCQLIVHPATKFPSALERLKQKKSTGKADAAIAPASLELVGVLRQLLQENHSNHYFLVVDALNEAENSFSLTDVSKILAGVFTSTAANIHLLVTSTSQAESSLDQLPIFSEISIEKHTKIDVEKVVSFRLQEDIHFRHWPEEQRQLTQKKLLTTNLTFRLVDQSLEELRRGPLTTLDLWKQLDDLPDTSTDRWQMELDRIPSASAGNAIKLLQWLAYPQRKLRLEEAVEVLAVGVDQDPPRFEPRNRMFSGKLLELCGTLVELEEGRGWDHFGGLAQVKTVSLSQTEIKDFLESRPIVIGGVEAFFWRPAVNLQMAETCLTYLDYIFRTVELTKHNLSRFPFARYAAENWDDCYREASVAADSLDMRRLNSMILRLLKDMRAMRTYVQLCDPEYDSRRSYYGMPSSDISSPLYYAALHGLTGVVNILLDEGADIDQQSESLFGTPLVAAIVKGRIDVVRVLLARGANPMQHSKLWGAPIDAARAKDHKEIVDLLMQSPAVAESINRTWNGFVDQGTARIESPQPSDGWQDLYAGPGETQSNMYNTPGSTSVAFTSAPEANSNPVCVVAGNNGLDTSVHGVVNLNDMPPPTPSIIHHHTFPLIQAHPEQSWRHNSISQVPGQQGPPSSPSHQPQAQPFFTVQTSDAYVENQAPYREPQQAPEYAVDPRYNSLHAMRHYSVPAVSFHHQMPDPRASYQLPLSHPYSTCSSPGVAQLPPQVSPHMPLYSPPQTYSPAPMSDPRASYFSASPAPVPDMVAFNNLSVQDDDYEQGLPTALRRSSQCFNGMQGTLPNGLRIGRRESEW